MRSSLRKSNYSAVNYAVSGTSGGGLSSTTINCGGNGFVVGNSNTRLWNGGGVGSGGECTPTNPTPPDSMHSEDSLYVSAKDTTSSQHSSVSALRVRFSPLAAVSGDSRSTLIDNPVQGQSQDYTIPLKVFQLCQLLLVFIINYHSFSLQAARPVRRDFVSTSIPPRSCKYLTEQDRDFL